MPTAPERSAETYRIFGGGSDPAGRIRRMVVGPEWPGARLRISPEGVSIVPETAFTPADLVVARTVIGNAISESLRILDLKDNWDDEGARGYSEEVWRRATKFINDTSEEFMRTLHRAIPPPRILPGPDGSIDINWRHNAKELLINIPASPSEPPDFYGDAGQGSSQTIKGTLLLASPQIWLLTWLTT